MTTTAVALRQPCRWEHCGRTSAGVICRTGETHSMASNPTAIDTTTAGGPR